MRKRILWNSDLWPVAQAFAVITLFCLLFLLLQIAHDANSGQVFSSVFMAAIPGMIAVGVALVDRTEAMCAHSMTEELLEKRPYTAITKDTMLDPEHPVIAARIKNPPTLG